MFRYETSSTSPSVYAKRRNFNDEVAKEWLIKQYLTLFRVCLHKGKETLKRTRQADVMPATGIGLTMTGLDLLEFRRARSE
ncbi:hypothetical protein QWA_06615 [Alcaligenes faecalis subsp. faecalis NCIB 8687]|nr:hypothetical protein QWA_06615 [Alcaligenes faecalis subsp. faecalis NCIB 8687]